MSTRSVGLPPETAWDRSLEWMGLPVAVILGGWVAIALVSHRHRGPARVDSTTGRRDRRDAHRGHARPDRDASGLTGRRRQRTRDGPRPEGASARWSVSRVLSHHASRRAGDDHPSVAAGRPTAHAADPRAGQRTSPPSTVARRRVAPSYLALLRVEFARFTPDDGLSRAGIVTVALVLASRRAGVTRHPALRSSDFPHAPCGVAPTGRARPSDHLADPTIVLGRVRTLSHWPFSIRCSGTSGRYRSRSGSAGRQE